VIFGRFIFYNANQEPIMTTVAPTLSTPTHAFSHEQRLDRLAEVAVKAGLGLAHGQELLLTAPLDALPLVRRVVEHAYKAGASLVTTFLTDDELTLARFRFAPDDAFDRANIWLQEGIASAYRSGAARLGITGGNPALLAQQDPGKVGRANLAASKASRPALDLITRQEINWSIIASATPAWAALAFPNEAPENAVAKLWDAIFASTRIDAADPVAAWKAHSQHLQQRAALLNEKRFDALHFKSSATDLHVDLSDGHKWLGGGTIAGNGIPCLPNMPTEEVFTTPHKDRTEGTVASTKPLSYQGVLIKDIRVRFEQGRIVEATASEGQSALDKMIGSDDGARRLGEVALVPHSSPISASGLLFWNTLFDENAASHIALGQAYSTCVEGGDTMTPEQLASRGANDSLIHVDWMIGSGEMNVDGIRNGQAEPLMRKGEWV
jgi:aminopeptidase